MQTLRRTLVVLLVLSLVAPMAMGVPVLATGASSTGSHSATGGAAQECALPVAVTDGTGATVTVESTPQRVVAVGASAAQVLWELGVEDRVVGMDRAPYTAYLEGSAEKTGVLNDDGSVDQERVVALEPDLVIMANIYSNETVETLRGAGLTVYKDDFPDSLAGIRSSVDTYGTLLGVCDRADSVNAAFDESLAAIEQRTAARQNPDVLYYFYNFTAGSETFTDELIEAAGGTNVAARAGVEGYAQMNLELVVQQDPQVVVVPEASPLPTGTPWNATTAFSDDAIVRVDTDLAQQPGPRVLTPIRTMETAFAEASAREPTAPTRPASAAQSVLAGGLVLVVVLAVGLAVGAARIGRP